MASVLTTLGAQTYNTWTSEASGTDKVSPYDPYDDYASALTGAIGDSYSRPILFRYLQIYTWQDNANGSIDLEIATASTGGGGTQSSAIANSDADPDWNVTDSSTFGPLQYAAFAKDSANTTLRYYYGFYKNDAYQVSYNTGASTDTAANPNSVYSNGTVEYSTRVIAGRIGWYHVPYAPTGATLVSNTPTSIAFRWTHPTDDGISTSLPFGGLYGYRIAYKKSTDATWSVFGAGTSGSPSGCHYIQGTGAYNYTTTPPVATPSATYKFTTTGGYENVTSLTPNTNYNFKVAGLNLPSDRHNGAGGSYVTSGTTTSGTRSYGNYTAVTDHVGTNLDATYRTLLRAPSIIQTGGIDNTYTTTGSVNVAYSSSTIFTQNTDGGAYTNYSLTYSISSGSLPSGSGLTLNTSTGTISGTPTVSGQYTFKVTATNLDGQATQSATQTITISALGPKVVPTNGGTPTSRAVTKVWNGTSFTTAETKVYDGTQPYSPSGWKYLT